MTTAAAEPSIASEVDQQIGYNVHGLLYRQRHNQKQLAQVLGITPSVLSKKLRGESAWSARQVAVSAQFLGVTAGKLYEATERRVSPKLTAITGEGRASTPQMPMLHRVP